MNKNRIIIIIIMKKNYRIKKMKNEKIFVLEIMITNNENKLHIKSDLFSLFLKKQRKIMTT